MTTQEMIECFGKSDFAPKYFDKVSATSFPMELIRSKEEKFGKQFIEFNTEECKEYTIAFINSRVFLNGVVGQQSISTYVNARRMYRGLWDWYIDNVKVIKNVWAQDAIFNEAGVCEWGYGDKKKPLDVCEKAIEKIHDAFYGDYATYLECLILCFYNGFATAKDFPMLKEEDIDFEAKTIRLTDKRGYRIIHPSDRLLELLQSVHRIDYFDHGNSESHCLAWRDGYFHFVCRGTMNIDHEDFDRVTTRIRSSFLTVRNNVDFEITPRILYLVGFINWLIGKAGSREAASDIVFNSSNERKFVELMQEYGLAYVQPVGLRRQFKPYL